MKRRPGEAERDLMTEEQANAVEAVWQRRSDLIAAQNECQAIGVSADILNEALAAEGKDVQAAIRRVLEEVAATSTDRHVRSMANQLLAVRLARAGEPCWIERRLQAVREDLLHYQEQGVPLVDVLPGGGGKQIFCESMREHQALTIERALAEMPIPNRDCPTGFGEIGSGFCTCGFVAASAWLSRHR